MGAFEVYFMGVLIYSKIKTGQFPNITAVSKKCCEAYNEYI